MSTAPTAPPPSAAALRISLSERDHRALRAVASRERPDVVEAHGAGYGAIVWAGDALASEADSLADGVPVAPEVDVVPQPRGRPRLARPTDRLTRTISVRVSRDTLSHLADAAEALAAETGKRWTPAKVARRVLRARIALED